MHARLVFGNGAWFCRQMLFRPTLTAIFKNGGHVQKFSSAVPKTINCNNQGLPSVENQTKHADTVPLDQAGCYDLRYVETKLLQSFNFKRHLADMRASKAAYDFRVAYVDTRPNCKDHPVVVCLHGVPGNHKDFEKITKYFHSSGSRVVCLNFPDNILTSSAQITKLTFTTEERSAYVKEFLHQLGIDKVDMFVCHSSACFPVSNLAVTCPGYVGSMAMLCPVHIHCRRIMFQPAWLWEIYNKIMGPHNNQILNFAANKLVSGLAALSMPLVGVKNPFSVKTPHLFFGVVFRGGSTQYPENLIAMRKKHIPILHLYGEKDKIIPKWQSKLMNEVLDIKSDQLIYFDNEGKPRNTVDEKSVTRDGFVLAAGFENGKHSTYKQYPDITNSLLLQLFNQATRKQNVK